VNFVRNCIKERSGFMSKKYLFFTSQTDPDYYPEVGCGVASLMMLLKAVDFKPLPSWRELCDELHLTKPTRQKGYSSKDPALGLYSEDLFKFVIKSHLPFRMHFFAKEWGASLKKAPIMVLMAENPKEFGQEGHWVILVSRKKEFFTYLDPWYKSDYTKHISSVGFKKYYKKYYTGIALQILKEKI
jgi:hypothetical protein